MHDELLNIIASTGMAVADHSDGVSEQGVTLLVGGMLVTGIVISQKEYFLSHPILEVMSEEKKLLPPYMRLPENYDHRAFIHLKGAQFITPGQPPISNPTGIFWRGRIDRVDGFFIGHTAVTKNQAGPAHG